MGTFLLLVQNSHQLFVKMTLCPPSLSSFPFFIPSSAPVHINWASTRSGAQPTQALSFNRDVLFSLFFLTAFIRQWVEEKMKVSIIASQDFFGWKLASFYAIAQHPPTTTTASFSLLASPCILFWNAWRVIYQAKCTRCLQRTKTTLIQVMLMTMPLENVVVEM